MPKLAAKEIFAASVYLMKVGLALEIINTKVCGGKEVFPGKFLLPHKVENDVKIR